jgi:acyl-CoA thioesterase I
VVFDTVMRNPITQPCCPHRPVGAMEPIERYALPERFFNCLATVLIIFIAAMGAAKAAEPVRLLALGDSLTAGYGLPVEDGFTHRLEARLRAEGFAVTVLNAGVSGDTSAGGRARLAWSLSDKPTHAIIELGANDGLRGLDPDAMRSNLEAIVTRLKAAGVRILLTGMQAPPNYGRLYEEAYNRVYPELAKKHGVLLYPFFLAGVVTRPDLNQRDGIHPNRNGVTVIVDRITPYVVRLLKDRE